jgi:hypothetical protein
MLRLLASLPVLAITFLYAWSLALKYGVVLGLHIFVLAISFFYMCTPLPSYLYVLGLLPEKIRRNGSGIGPIVVWMLLFFFNYLTYLYIPGLFKKTPITTLAAYIAYTPGTRFTLIPLSGLSLLYHWAIAHINNRAVRFLAHLLGVVTSAFIFTNLYWMYRDGLVVFLNSGSINY